MTQINDRKTIKELMENTKQFVIPASTVTLANERKLIVKGQEMPMTASAWKDLLSIAGVTQKITNHLNSTMKNGAGYTMVRALLRAMKGNGGSFKIYLDTDQKKVVRIIDADEQGGASISADAVEQFLDYILKTSGGRVQLREMFSTDGGTKVTFNLKYTDEVPLQIPGEDISLGKQWVWDLLGPSEVSDFVERLICTNGMTGIVPGVNAVYLDGGSSTSDWYNTIFHDINNPNEAIIKQYENAMMRARQSHLSVREYEDVRNYLESNWVQDASMINDVFGDDEELRRIYDSRGINLRNASERQKSNMITPVQAWDALNLMTDLASHKYKTPVSDGVRKATQKKAGKIMNSAWDEDGIIYNAPRLKDFGSKWS